MTDFPQHYHYFGQTEFDYAGETIRTLNNLLLTYDGADGIKTGYTVASGFNLVSSARRDGRRLIGVVFGGNSVRTRDAHMADLLDAGFAEMAGNTGALALAPQLEDLENASPLPKFAAANTTGIGDTDTDEPPPRAARNRPASVAVTDPERQWGIQIGAYGSRAKAAEMAALARSRLVASYAGVVERVEPARWKGDKMLFRAQVIGLKQADTAAACKLAGIETKVGCKPVTLAAAKPKKAPTRTARR
jgi:D-alanyl-D-alanine carboxypeptidase